MEWNQIIPEFDVFDLEDSLHFYIDLLGFTKVYDRKEDKFAFLQLEKIQLMIQEIDDKNIKWETAGLEYPLGVGINFQIDVTNYELYLFAKYINDITGVYNQISDNFYMSQIPPGKKTFSGLCSYCDLAIGGFAKYNNCYITSNNNSYFKMLKGRNSSHFELINNHIT